MRKRLSLLSFLVIAAICCALFAVACASTPKHKVTWTLDENVQAVTIDGYTYAQEMEIEEGKEVSFTLTFKTGWEAGTVQKGNTTIRPTNGTYKFTVDADTKITVNSKETLSSITAALKDTTKVYYAGDTVEAADLTVTASYATGRTEVVTGATISYANDKKSLSLGDTSFTVSYVGKETVVEFTKAIEGLITLNLDGGFFTETPQGFTKVSDSIYTKTFTEPLASDIELPEPTKLVNPDDESTALYFDRWSGVENNKIASGLNTSLTAIALYDNALVEVTEMKFEEKAGKAYLVIKGEFRAADSAYLYLYEGNEPPVEYGEKTYAQSTDGKTFTLEFDLIKFITSKPINPDTKEEMTGSFLGKWMDIRFCVEYGDSVIHQELFVSDDMTYANLGDDIVTKSVEGEETKFYRFFYETYSPEAGKPITGVPGATFTGTEKILKLHCEETAPYKLDNVTLEKRTVEGKEVAYIVVNGTYLGEAESAAELKEIIEAIYIDLQNNDGANGRGWGMYLNNGDQEVEVTFKANGDSTFKILLSLAGVPHGGVTFSHIGSSSANLEKVIEKVELTVGGLNYTLENWTGWGSQLVCCFVENPAFANDRSIILENGKPYFILMGDAEGRTAEEIKAALTQFDFEEDGNSENKIIISADKIFVTVENGIYTVKVDVSEIPLGRYWMHAVGLIEGNGDVAPDASKPSVTFDGKIYQGIDDPRDGWTAHLFEVADANAPALAYTGADIKVEGDKLLYIITGTYENYTKAQLEALYINFDLQGNPYVLTGSWEGDWYFYHEFTPILVVNEADGTFTITIDISSLITNEHSYTTHLELSTTENTNPGEDEGQVKNADFKPETDNISKTVTFNGYSIKLLYVKGSGDGAEFWGCVGLIVTAAE